MNFGETFRDALDNLAAHKLRAALSMLGMIFGVGAVIAMLSIGAGAEREALAMIEQLGLRNIVIEAKTLNREDLMEIRQQSPGLSGRDVEAVAEAIPEIEWVAPRVKVEPYKVASSKGKTDAMAYGVSRRFFELGSHVLAEGRVLDALDEETHAQVCVIGKSVALDLFGYEPVIGKTIKVDDVWLEVVGILASEAAGPTRFKVCT